MSTAMGGVGGPPHVPPAARPGAAVGSAFGAPMGPRPVARGGGGDSNAGQVIKLVAIPIVLLAVVGGAVFGFRKLSGNKTDLGPALGKDREVRAMMRDDGAYELKKWLADGGNRRMVTGMTVQQADGLADRLYTMGAVKVYAFGGVVTMSIAVELPKDPDKRKELFDWHKRWVEDKGGQFSRDEGQQYLLVRTGI
jgi:hypothetical protein